jgi:hypothetical protein
MSRTFRDDLMEREGRVSHTKRIILILAALAVLNFSTRCTADTWITNEHHYTVGFRGERFGFVDGCLYVDGDPPQEHFFSLIDLGPAGTYSVPFTAAQGFVGSILLITVLIMLALLFTVRWKLNRVGRRASRV